MRIQNKIRGLLALITLACLPSLLNGQEIRLTNPSFDDGAKHSKTPYGWYNCGDEEESPPDIQPGFFEVEKKPQKGKSFLGLVTRDNDTQEGISQKLGYALKPGECYNFSLYLAKAANYISVSRTTNKEENFKEAIRLKIWGGNSQCGQVELLAETPPIANIAWKKFDFTFKPKKSHKYIYLQADYKRGAFFPYNGNLLIDNCSSIKSCNAPATIIASIDAKVVDKKTGRAIKGAKLKLINISTGKSRAKSSASSNKYLWRDVDQGTTLRLIANKKGYIQKSRTISTKGLSKTKTFVVVMSLEKEKEEVIAVVDDPKPPVKKPPIKDKEPKTKKAVVSLDETIAVEDLREGVTLRTEEIAFAADSWDLKKTSFPVLNNVYLLLRNNPSMKIEVGGHTNDVPAHDYCDMLSGKRAKSVASYLTKKGIPANRITSLGYGKREPIATNTTKEGRKKNQRVDIKIISFK